MVKRRNPKTGKMATVPYWQKGPKAPTYGKNRGKIVEEKTEEGTDDPPPPESP